MFTGIVEEIGIVKSMTLVHDLLRWDNSKGDGYILVVFVKVALDGLSCIFFSLAFLILHTSLSKSLIAV